MRAVEDVVAVAGHAMFDSLETGTEMLFDVNTRATRRMRHNQDDFQEIAQQLKAQGGVPGKPPAIVPVYADTFPSANDTTMSGSGPARMDYANARDAFVGSFCAANNSCLCDDPSGCGTDPVQASTYTKLYLNKYILAASPPRMMT